MSIAPPTTKRPPLKTKHKVPIIVAGIGAAGLLLAALIPILVNQLNKPVTPSPVPSSTSPPVPGPVPPPTPAPIPSPTPTVTDPTGVTVRRSTGDNPLTLSTGYSADLDTMNRSWDVEYAATLSRFDIDLGTGVGVIAGSGSDIAIVDGPALYEICADATGYTKRIPRDELRQGVTACVRTSEKRLASVTIKKATPRDSPDQIQLNVTVWDPPFEE